MLLLELPLILKILVHDKNEYRALILMNLSKVFVSISRDPTCLWL